MFQFWQELINGRNCEFKLTRDPRLIPRRIGISLHMALSAKHWPEIFCEQGQRGTSSARSTSPGPNFSPRSFSLAIKPRSPDLNLSQPASFHADPFFSHYMFMSLEAMSFSRSKLLRCIQYPSKHWPKPAWHTREIPWLSVRDLP